MEKVLIIGYFYPPCNLTPSQRMHSWAKYLHEFGYHPVIVTRKWEKKVETLKDASFPTSRGDKVIHEQNYEVHYVPYNSNLRDKIFIANEDRFNIVRRGLTVMNLIGEHYSNSFIPYGNMYTKAEELIQKYNIKKCLITASPFNLFRFGYLLNKYHHVKWVADYRDAWTTSEIHSPNRNVIFKIIDQLNRKFEKKWVSTASQITSVSPDLAKGINQLTGVKDSPVYNGFESDDFDSLPDFPKYENFTITYIGSLYDKQPIEFFLDAFIKLIKKTNDQSIRLYCPGLDFFSEQKTRINSYLKEFSNQFEATPRIPRIKILEIEKRSHALLYVAWKGHKGVVPSKIYEYLPTGTVVIVAPTDHSVVHEIMEESNAGISTDNATELFDFIYNLYKKFKLGENLRSKAEGNAIQKFSRYEQVKKMAEILNNI
ncbi:MAG: hypothetical protein R2730_08885 [Chitinophagales bacterium]